VNGASDIGCSILRLGGTWLFPLSFSELVQICSSTLFWLYISCFKWLSEYIYILLGELFSVEFLSNQESFFDLND
jgi:hypothetical protein